MTIDELIKDFTEQFGDKPVGYAFCSGEVKLKDSVLFEPIINFILADRKAVLEMVRRPLDEAKADDVADLSDGEAYIDSALS